ncbi:MAG: hypothetical protein O8C61_00880 [Candidatus Methanoperedens sp.]|nr:hypothetical protein [Candidatus Methanoperedens sp.]
MRIITDDGLYNLITKGNNDINREFTPLRLTMSDMDNAMAGSENGANINECKRDN